LVTLRRPTGSARLTFLLGISALRASNITL